MDVFLFNLTVVFAVAVVFGILFRFFGLPSIVGQVLAGFVVGILGFIGKEGIDSISILGSLGVTLLLFLVGLEMNLREIRNIGKTVLRLFAGQTLLLGLLFFTFLFFVLRLGQIPSVFLTLALTFSSTIVVVKTLSEKRDLGSFSGKLSLGILLLQDLLAIFLLVLMPGLSQGVEFSSIINLIFKLFILLLTINVFGHFVISLVEKYLIKSAEDLVLISLVWFFLAVFFSVNVLGLTPEIGGILAGISLSNSWGHFQIVSKIKTIRDVFLTLFFVLLGLEIGVGSVNWLLVLEITVLALVGKFLISEIVCLWNGLSGKISFSISLNMTPISEFSLIVMSFGLISGFWDSSVVTAVTVAGLITMVLSTIFIYRSSGMYKLLSDKFPKMFGFDGIRKGTPTTLKNHIVLLGGDRTGRSILASLKKNGEKVLVIDFNPDIISRLNNRGEEAILSDASDPDVLEISNMQEAKMIISTVKDLDDSLALLSLLRQKKIEVPTIVDAETPSQASILYDAGASYVIFPHFVSGLHLGSVMKKYKNDKDILNKYKSRQSHTLKEIYEGDFK